jgi:hypothetical protein
LRHAPIVHHLRRMNKIDWPLAVMLAVMFVVMSLVRWRYFKRWAGRRDKKGR